MASKRLMHRLVARGLLLATLTLVCFSEILIYHINEWSWKQIYCRQENCTRILFVADPQLLGKTFDTSWYSALARNDADRYLKKTFEHASAFTKPDIVCFMGDLLDEGNIASPQLYSTYVRRFKNIFHANQNVQRIHIPGDNDIGGENGDYISNSNIRRFEIEFMYQDLFDYDNRLRFFKINRMVMDFTNPDRDNNMDRTRIGLSHMPLLMSGGPLLRNVLSDIDPHVMFSAHWHESRIFLYPSTNSIHFYQNEIRTFDLNELKNEHTYLEIMIPTSSYRMGKPRMGYGFAVLENNMLYYTVLWGNNRFICLIIYVIWTVCAITIYILVNMMTRCPFRVAKRHTQHRYCTIPQF
ncbi:metallophosphoesterase 1 homolog [Episyrphus balteatus]|uniref:metallophosphoesterase 1 homolog n=1 Tax=Episyrphus balteatus TaxID=286459 RepID=UPI0024854D71|nr:metallophosphoesterase 1 homolog [Episyrphus balteatus]